MPARSHRQLVVALFLSLLSGGGSAQVTTPTAGSAERKAIMDSLRAPVEKRLRKKVVFKVDHLKVEGGWAFLRGVPQQPGGKAMDYRDTGYAGAIREGIFDDWICALLRKQGSRWEVVTFVIGATDVPWVDWGERYKAPPGIFE